MNLSPDYVRELVAKGAVVGPLAQMPQETPRIDGTEPLSTEAQMPKRKPRKRLATGWAVTLNLFCQVCSEANQRCHWAVRRRRFAAQAEALGVAWICSPLDRPIAHRLPFAVTFTHIGRKMDSDNLAGAFKGLRDKLADLIGVDDGDERIDWRYEQERGPAGVKVTISAGVTP